MIKWHTFKIAYLMLMCIYKMFKLELHVLYSYIHGVVPVITSQEQNSLRLSMQLNLCKTATLKKTETWF